MYANKLGFVGRTSVDCSKPAVMYEDNAPEIAGVVSVGNLKEKALICWLEIYLLNNLEPLESLVSNESILWKTHIFLFRTHVYMQRVQKLVMMVRIRA